MIRSRFVIPILLLLGIQQNLVAMTVTIARDGRPTSAIVVGKSAAAPEHHAASELRRYVKQMTAAEVPIVGETDPLVGKKRNIVVIGNPETNRVLAQLHGKKLLGPSFDGLAHDGFILKTLRDAETNYLVIASPLPRGCLHGVYHLLEEYFHVGFFWDGDLIPSSKQLLVNSIERAETPHFPDREYMQLCAYGYTATFWGLEEWKNELNWAAKKKFNLIQLTFGHTVSRYNALKALGVDSTPPTEWERHESSLAQQLSVYARQLGLRIVHPAFDGLVPPEFREKHPSIKLIEVRWLDLPPHLYILPSDPMFVKVGSRFIEEHNKLCGTDHFYNVDPYPETDPGNTPEEKLKVKVDFARAVAKSIKQADPRGTWVMSGWAFTDATIWTKQDVKAFLQVVPRDMFVVNDIWAEHNPIYKKFDYFHGKRWGFSVLHSMGGWTTIHGDLADLIRRVQDVVSDPKAIHCTNFYLNPEILNHNDVYFDLSARLAWNPVGLELHTYLDDYLTRRYGAEAAPGMRKSWDKLLESAYGHYDFTAPAYQDRLSLDVHEIYGTLRNRYIPHLRRALELALTQEPLLHQNNFYQRDIVDVTRQYVGEVFNLHFEKLVSAFKSHDTVSFEREAKVLKSCLECQEKILSSHAAFYMAGEVELSRKLPKFSSPYYAHSVPLLSDNSAAIRQRYTALGGVMYYPTLIDYARKDVYELIKFYYRGRLDLYLDYLRERLAKSEPFSFEDIEKQNREWTEKFINVPYKDIDPSRSPYYGKPGRAAREILATLAEHGG